MARSRVGGIGSSGRVGFDNRGGIWIGGRGQGGIPVASWCSGGFSLDAGNTYEHQVDIQANETYKLLRAGVMNDSRNTPANLLVEVENLDGSVVYSKSVQSEVGGVDNPLAEISGATDVEMAIVNNTGSTQNVYGTFIFVVN